MRTIVTTLLIAFLAFNFSNAQKFGYVDTDDILKQMPAYKAAQEEIEQISKTWQSDLEKMYKEIEQKYKEYQAEEVLLPDDIKKQRQESIFELERKAKEYKKSKFGYDGELYKLQDDKIKPIQDQVYSAVNLLCKEKKLDFIFDKTANSGIIYSNPLYDRTGDVKNRLGLGK